jgi:SET domain-containing protein
LDNERTEQYRIGDSKFGKGVFATQAITKGSLVLKLTGPQISLQEVYLKGEHQCNPLQIADEMYIDLEPPGLLINHHCNPNCGILNDDTIIALRDIEAGEEIFYDYSTTISDDFEEDGSEFFMPCDCEDIQCRNKIGDFKYLSESKQQYYLSNNTVMSFIVEKIWAKKIENPLTSDSKK